MNSDAGGHPWFALLVQGRKEKFVSTLLRNKEYEDFLPLYRTVTRWSDRLKEVEKPLFPGYVFCRLDINKRLPVLVTPGVIRIVGGAEGPTPVDTAEIEAIRRLLQTRLECEPWPFVQVGQRVRIATGPLAGVEGILQTVRKHHRLVLSITLLQRSVSVEVDQYSVEPVREFIGPGVVRPAASGRGEIVRL